MHYRLFSPGSARFRVRPFYLATLLALSSHPAAAIAAADPAESNADAIAAAAETSMAVQLDSVTVKAQSPHYVAKEADAATKTGTPLIETPQAVSVITRDQLDAQQANTLSEALRYTAGVTAQVYGNDSRYNWYNIRGFPANDYTFQDGLRITSGYFMQPAPDPYGFAGVQIIKGPSSVLYGQGSPGGLVNIDSKLPTEQPTGNVGLTYGNYNLRQVTADSAGPITADGRLSYRITALGKASNTQVEGAGNNRGLVAPAITWKPFDGTRITFLGNYQDDDASPVTTGTYSPNALQQLAPVLQRLGRPTTVQVIDRSTSIGVPGDDLERAVSSIGYLLDQRIDDVWSFHQGVRLTHIGGFYKSVGLVGIVPPMPADPASVTAFPYLLSRKTVLYDEQLNSAVVDTHAQAKWSSGTFENTAIAGLDYQSLWNHYVGAAGQPATFDIRDQAASAVPPPADTPVSNIITRGRQVGFYGQAQTKYDQHWVGVASLRRDWAPYQYQDNLAQQTTDFNDHQWTYRVGGVYLSDAGLAPYVNYSTSFQPNTGTGENGTPFKPTEGRNMEAGLRWQPKNLQLWVTVSAFDIHNKNVVQSDPQDPTIQIQTGEVRSRGFEAETLARLFRDLDLIASYTFLDAKNTEATPSTEGRRPQNVPRNSASLWTDYKFPDSVWLSGFGLGAGVRYVGSTLDYSGLYSTPSFTLLDAAVHYDWQRWRLALNLANALDRTTLSNCGNLICNYGDARTIRGAVSYRW